MYLLPLLIICKLAVIYRYLVFFHDPILLITNYYISLVVSGDNGAMLGCVGEVVEFLMLSILNDKYTLSVAKGAEPRTNYGCITHSHWMAPGNCTTTYCMLADGVPLHTWTSVGNGSYNGAAYEFHFINTGKIHGYSATRGLPSNSTMVSHLERRGIPSGRGARGCPAQILFKPGMMEP